MKGWRWMLTLGLASCMGGYPRCGSLPNEPDAERLVARRIGPCTYEYNSPLSFRRGGVVVEINGLAASDYEVDEINRRLSFPCNRRDAGEPTDVVILYLYLH